MTSPKRLFRKLLLTGWLLSAGLAPALLPTETQALNPAAPFFSASAFVGEETTLTVDAGETFYCTFSQAELSIEWEVDFSYTPPRATIYITPLQTGEFIFSIYKDSAFYRSYTVKATPKEPYTIKPVHCFWSDSKGAYYTINESEKESILSHPEWGWTYWGISYYAYVKN
jgi:hypothetical protein